MLHSTKRKETANKHFMLTKENTPMKKIIICILISLTGSVIMAASFMYLLNVSEILYKFAVFFGAILFGGGIASLMVSRAAKKAPKDSED